jgi:hypothetical protein
VSLTREQALAAAWLALAFEAPLPPPGGTIAQGAAAAQAGAAALHKGSAAPKKVATAPGSAKYHAPIGALIIPHGHPSGKLHYAAGAPGHMIHDVSEAKWIANQWKDKGHAKAEAEKAVAAGTHHWVQSGEHTFAVHNGLETHIPKDIDVHDEAAVKNAPKVIVKHGPHPEHVMLKPEGPGEPQPHDAGAQHLVKTGYKKLPEQPAKKAVTFAGKHAAWVPHDWQVYKSKEAAESGDESKLGGKFAKDPAGKWHFIDKSGGIDKGPQGQPEEWEKSGGIVPDEDHPGPEPGHVAPNQAAEGHEPAKANIGGVAVTKEQIHDAIAKLQGSASTQIKGLLKGHPLEASDYHSVFKAELEAHPELKVPSGTKKQHASPAKLAFIHHLAGQAGKLAQDEAQAQAAKEAKEKAEAAAAHAQQLTPGTYEVGGVHVTVEEIQQAIAKLEGSASTQIKGLLKGNPLAGSDYWAVVNAYKDAHPTEFGKGTKQAHVAKAKPLFVAALKELSSQAATGEVQSGHAEAAAIDQAISEKFLKDGWNLSSNGAVVKAMFDAAGKGHARFAHLGPEPGTWIVTMFPPSGKAYYEVTPEHKVTFHLADGSTSHDWPAEQAAEAVKDWTTDSPPPEPKAPEPSAPEPEPQLILDTLAWKQTPEYAAVHDLVLSHQGLPPHDNKLDTDQQLAAALKIAGTTYTRYLVPGLDGGWVLASKVPAGIAGTFGIPGKAYYEITPNHEIVAYGTDGQGTALPGETVKQIAEKWLTPPPEPEPAEPGFDVTAGGNTLHVPAGSQVYVNVKHPDVTPGSDWADVKYVKKPDGSWDYVQKVNAGPMDAGAKYTLDAEVKSGHMVPWPPEKPVPAPEPEKPAEPGPGADIQQLKTLLINGAVKPSTAVEEGKSNPDWALVNTLKTAAKASTEKWVVKQSWNNSWTSYAYQPYLSPDDTQTEFFHVTGDLAVTHHAGGKDTVLPPEKVSEIVQQLVVPDSVKIPGPYGGWNIYKHGFYYKSSKGAKAFLEIAPWKPGSPATGATFIYHAPSGDKQVKASYAAKVLTDATEYHVQAKDAPNLAAKKVSYATVFKTGDSYPLWSDITHGPSAEHTFMQHGDESALLSGPGGSTPLAAESKPADGLLKGGGILDSYGTTVVKPGIVPDKYHVFGSEAKTPDQLKALLVKFEAAYADQPALSALVKETWTGLAQSKLAMSFFSVKLGESDWTGQRDAVMGLLRELLKVPEQPPGTATGPEVKFLKGLPPGIAKAEDIFTWTPKGLAKPAGSLPDLKTLPWQQATTLAANIKDISAQFGGGKVVGTHVSSLSKDQKAAWLKAWIAGDMKSVFALDASGGKVSPAHPGAPENTATHYISWSPWDDSQVPASQAVEGEWSPEGVLPPKAEVDNFLIKAGLQHAAWLSAKQRREWMTAHRAHDQQAVDKLSQQAADAFASGAQPKSEPPVFTENLAPAKPWDAFLDEQMPAQQWPKDVLDSFVTAHKAELSPFVKQAGEQYGGSGSYSVDDLLASSFYYSSYVKKAAVQAYLDDLAAKEAAEKLKPKYHLASGGIAEDQFGRQYQWVTGTKAQLARRTAVAQLARAWGFRTPQVTAVKLEDGTAGAVIPLLDHNGTLAGLDAQGMKLLTGRQLGDIAREHVLDFALANPGSAPGSYLRLADGSVIGADKSAALTALEWAGTDPVMMNAHATQPVSLVLSAISQGWLDQEQAGAAYTAAIRAARRMAALPDSRMQQALAGVPATDAAVQQLVARKNALPGQIQAMWDQAFAARGWTPPEIPVAKLSRGLHSGFSEPEFMDHVAAAKSFGVPAFFAEPGLANGHVLVWTELAPGGERMVRGEAAIRGHVMDKVTGWVKAHSGDSATMVPKGEGEIHQAIKTAAEVINTHAKDGDFSGPISYKAMSELAGAKSKLQQMLADAQHAEAAGPASAAYAQVAKDHGDPGAVASMAQHYLAQIDTAEHAKVSGAGGLTPDQFPGWQPTEQTHALGGGVKITYKKSSRQLGTNASEVTADTWSLGKEDGELHLAAGKKADFPGYVWEVKLPTGEVIEINDSGETQTPKAHTGMVRFAAVTGDGSASLERVRAFLQQAGIGMEEATQPDMENLYWRTLAWALSDRADRKDPKHLKVWDELAQALHGKNAGEVTGPGKPAKYIGELPAQVIQKNMAPEEEAQLWRKAWAHLTSPEQVQQWVDNEGYLPHLGHHDIRAPEVPGGKLDWYRFDVTPEQAAARQFVTESFYDSAKDAALIARSGGLYSSDARLRALGTYKTGMSWGSDMQKGSSGVVFTRQNQESDTSKGAWISPRVMARVQTYAFDSDHFGETDARRTYSYFDFAKATSHSMPGNEAMVLDAISLLDDIEVLKAHSEAQRKQIIADLKAAGLTEIRGLPVEDRIVTSPGVAAAIKKAKAALAADGWFAQTENPYVPPPSALSGAPAAEKKFVSQVVAQEKIADAAAQAAQIAQKLEELATGQEVPFSNAF